MENGKSSLAKTVGYFPAQIFRRLEVGPNRTQLTGFYNATVPRVAAVASFAFASSCAA